MKTERIPTGPTYGWYRDRPAFEAVAAPKFYVHYKSDEHGSGCLDREFPTWAEAEKFIADLVATPHKFSYSDWVPEAALWVSSDDTRE
jgi:hypothetical protein